ncbi:Casp-like protein 1d1 [Thalictrum thalictroides]|uniref:CASP-like protein n=1 Tax=Thalictrum thalictroides TaxID=46969 RepID=A0A7J6WYT4_THATH|nr:Casp-like protein 1d1 [Thalictrum thalictroides]
MVPFEEHTGSKIASEAQVPRNNHSSAKVSHVGFFLRLLVFASSVAAVLVMLMVGIVVSATGTAGGVAYTGLKGDSRAGQAKICNVYDKFCLYVGISLGLSLFAYIMLGSV